MKEINKPTKEEINQIVNKILSLRKNKRFTIGDFLKKFDLTAEEKNFYAKQIYEGILGYVDFISGGSYTYDTLPCEKNERRPEKAVLRKTMLDNDGKEYETEEELDTTNIPDDIDSLKSALNKSKLKAIVDKYNIDYTKNLVSNEDLIKFEKIIDCKFGKQLKEYLLHYGYMGYKSIEFYGINSKQLEKSDMITQSLYLHEYFPKTKGLIAFENQGEGHYYLVDINDNVFWYQSVADEIYDIESKLYDFISNRFEFIDDALGKNQNLNKLKLLEKIEIKYNIPGMTALLNNVLTNQEKTYQNARLLSLEEILNADEDLQVDFVQYGLIPVFDVYDNDFICYQTKDGNWCKFNIVDEIRFQKDSRLEDLLK